jgi:hypothetical protein
MAGITARACPDPQGSERMSRNDVDLIGCMRKTQRVAPLARTVTTTGVPVAGAVPGETATERIRGAAVIPACAGEGSAVVPTTASAARARNGRNTRVLDALRRAVNRRRAG